MGSRWIRRYSKAPRGGTRFHTRFRHSTLVNALVLPSISFPFLENVTVGSESETQRGCWVPFALERLGIVAATTLQGGQVIVVVHLESNEPS